MSSMECVKLDKMNLNIYSVLFCNLLNGKTYMQILIQTYVHIYALLFIEVNLYKNANLILNLFLILQNKHFVVEPIDFENFILKNKTLIQNDPQRELLLYPTDDVSVSKLKLAQTLTHFSRSPRSVWY